MRAALLCIVTIIILPIRSAFAAEYVLPYPSLMPGHPLYSLRELVQHIDGYWHFGDIAQVKYHMKMADRYLVEANTLFEYGQLKLGVQALEKSDIHFTRAVLYERDVSYEKKDLGEKKLLLNNASEMHQEVLANLMDILPESVVWEEKNETPLTINLHSAIAKSRIVRTYASN